MTRGMLLDEEPEDYSDGDEAAAAERYSTDPYGNATRVQQLHGVDSTGALALLHPQIMGVNPPEGSTYRPHDAIVLPGQLVLLNSVVAACYGQYIC